MKKLTLAAVAATLIFAACGGSDSEDTADTEAPATEAPATEVPVETDAPVETEPPATEPPAMEGTIDNPFQMPVSTDNYGMVNITQPVMVGWPEVEAANQFNDKPQAGWTYVAANTTVDVSTDALEVVEGYEVEWSVELVDGNGTVYESAFVSDSDGRLALLGDQAAAPGGTMTGNILFLVPAEQVPTLTGVWNGTQFFNFA